jgi:type II secretory pathway pseudopilin PulG
MVTRFSIVIAAVVAVMALLVFLPSFNRKPSNDQTQLNVEFYRQQLTRAQTSGVFPATSADVLTVENDGSANYRKLVGAHDEKTFTVSHDDMMQLRGLILDTGFMNIPPTDYVQKGGLVNVTKYTLNVNANGNAKTINWIDPDSYNGTIPPIITNVASTLNSIISKYA